MSKGDPDRIPDAPTLCESIDRQPKQSADTLTHTHISKIKAHAGHAINDCTDKVARGGVTHTAQARA